MHTTELGSIEIREVEGQPSRITGMAVPYGVTIMAGYGRERFVKGAFADQVASVNSGERLAYLSRHGENGGVPVAVIANLEERDAGLFFAGEMLEDTPEVVQTRSIVARGINGVSMEFVPGKFRRKGDVVEHYAGARLAAIAGSYAPAYKQARVSIRSAAGAAGRMAKVPALSTAALTERRGVIMDQISTIRTLAETESRDIDDGETTEIATLEGRLSNIEKLIVTATEDAQRRDAERGSLPQKQVGTGQAVITRSETVYGPGRDVSFFADLMTQNRDASSAERMNRHRMLVADLADQIEKRAVTSGDLAGAYPTTYYPDLYVPDIAYTGPLSAFFASTAITAPNPISVPTFASVTGDTAVQASENTAVANVNVATAPRTLTPKTIGGESIVSRQSVDGASPGTDVIIGNQLRELLMRDTEREIALVLEALTTSGAIPDTAGTGGAQSGRDLYKGIAKVLGEYYAGAAAGGAGARMLPAEGVFVNSTDWGNLTAGEDTTGRPLLAYINPQNALGQQTAVGFQRGQIGGVPVEPAWSILSALNEIVARRNDAMQWKSAVLDIRLLEREGPQSVVFAIWQYFGFAILEPKGVRRYTYTNV